MISGWVSIPLHRDALGFGLFGIEFWLFDHASLIPWLTVGHFSRALLGAAAAWWNTYNDIGKLKISNIFFEEKNDAIKSWVKEKETHLNLPISDEKKISDKLEQLIIWFVTGRIEEILKENWEITRTGFAAMASMFKWREQEGEIWTTARVARLNVKESILGKVLARTKNILGSWFWHEPRIRGPPGCYPFLQGGTSPFLGRKFLFLFF